jgi:hypothetical protein
MEYRDTEIAALKFIAARCEKHGLDVRWAGRYKVEVKAPHLELRALIRPHREGSGLWITAIDRDGRKIFDGQDYSFMSELAPGMVRLEAYLADHGYITACYS